MLLSLMSAEKIIRENDMMRTLVIYKSNTGFVKKYAEWISQELSADIIEVSKANPSMLSFYDTIIYGGSLHAVGIIGLNFVKKNLGKLKDKKVIVFATGATPYREETIKEVRDKNFTSDEQEYIKFFYLRGGFDFSKLKLLDKILMTILWIKIKMKKKNELTSDEKGMLAAYYKPADFTKKEYIKPLVDCGNS